jgi:Flp pilus assembly protein TadG
LLRKRNFLRNDSGAAQLEFAFSVLPLLVLVLLTMEITSAVYTFEVLSDAANEGVRYAIVRTTDSTLTTDTATVVKNYAATSRHDMTNLSVSVSLPDGQTIPGRVQISVSYPYVPWVHFLATPPTMQAFAEGRLVY